METRAEIWKEFFAGLIKGATGEAGKFGFQKFGDALVCREEMKTSRVRVDAVPAPVIGRKILRFQVDLEVNETIEAVGSPKVEAAIRFLPALLEMAVPALLEMAVAHLLVSAALATIWVQLVQRILRWIKEKFEGQGKKNKDEGDSAASN